MTDEVTEIKEDWKTDENGNIHVTLPNVGDFVFGRPKLKHRKLVAKILKSIQPSPETTKQLKMIADTHGVDVDELDTVDEDKFSETEKEILSSNNDIEKVSDLLTEILLCTLKESPFKTINATVLEEELEYTDAIKLMQPGIFAIKEGMLSLADRKNWYQQ